MSYLEPIIVLIIESTVCFTQQQYFFWPNQHVAPSPRSLVATCSQFSGHELPIKQNGATPNHLHKGSTDANDDKTNERRIMR